MIGIIGNWIVNADTKAGLLATATAIIGGIMASQRASLRNAFRPQDPADLWELSTAALAILALLVCAVALVSVLRPRVRTGPYSRYSWPAVSSASFELVIEHAMHDSAIEAWRTVYDLSLIARKKFYWLKMAIFAWATAALSLFLWSIIRP